MKESISYKNKIKILKTFLRKRDCDYYLLPRTDKFMNEFNRNEVVNYFLSIGFNSISIDLDEAVSNRVNSYSIDIQSPRTPVYAFNDKTPSEVVSDSPLNVTLQFSIDADDYKIKNMRFVPEETVFKNVNVEIN